MTYHPSHVLKGIAASHERIDKICCDCGEVFEVARNVAKRKQRCTACQAEWTRAQDRASHAERRKEPRGTYTRHRAYRIIADPCRTWTPGGSLAYGELQDAALRGYLDNGMRWSNGKRTLVVVNSRLVVE